MNCADKKNLDDKSKAKSVSSKPCLKRTESASIVRALDKDSPISPRLTLKDRAQPLVTNPHQEVISVDLTVLLDKAETAATVPVASKAHLLELALAVLMVAITAI